jgi:cell wall-associated NlpC family hydrolase
MPVGTLGSSLGRFGLAAVLGTALAAAGQLPADARQAAPAVASVSFQRAAVPAAAAPLPAAAPSAAAVKSAATVSAAARRAKAIRYAKRYVGVRYRWGGTTPRGFDCSGYTRYVWKKAGKTLPRTSRAQYAKVRKISRAKARPGDLVFFKSSSGRVYHVGIYAGKNRMYDSPRPGKRVALRKIWSSRVSFGRV